MIRSGFRTIGRQNWFRTTKATVSNHREATVSNYRESPVLKYKEATVSKYGEGRGGGAIACRTIGKQHCLQRNKEMMIETQKLAYYFFDAIGITWNCNKPETPSKLNIYDDKNKLILFNLIPKSIKLGMYFELNMTELSFQNLLKKKQGPSIGTCFYNTSIEKTSKYTRV